MKTPGAMIMSLNYIKLYLNVVRRTAVSERHNGRLIFFLLKGK